MFVRTKARDSFEMNYQELQEPELDLKHMNNMDLTDSEIEFLRMKRMKGKRLNLYTPDPRLGEYET